MSSPREIELKLDVPVHDLPFLTASSLLKGTNKSAAKPVSLVSVYFELGARVVKGLRAARRDRMLVGDTNHEANLSG